jgi:hypothetical protein
MTVSRRLAVPALTLTPLLLMTSPALSIGRDFKRPSLDGLVLGRTTSAEVIAQLGPALGSGPPPQKEPEDHPPGLRPAPAFHDTKGLAYYYSYGPEEGRKDINSRRLLLYFLNDRLVVFTYASSMPGDVTNYDESKLPSFVRGRTTRADIVRDLGRPTGEGIYPAIAEQGNRMAAYYYAATKVAGSYFKPATETTMRTAQFLFDKSDRLIDTFTSNQTTTRGAYDKK